MRVVIRTDASDELGAGHLMRCVALADHLAETGAELLFVVRQAHLLISAGLAERPHALRVLDVPLAPSVEADAQATIAAIEGAADWIVLDHYGLDKRWESAVRSRAARLLVLDDLADRPHDCDVLVDPGFGRRPSDYAALLPRSAELLLGPQYALLRPMFAARHGSAAAWPQRKRIHVFFGGGESSLRWLAPCCERLLAALTSIELQAVGRADAAVMEAMQARFAPRLAWQPQVDNMADHMSACDAAIGGPGSATWERACIGLPSALLATTDNQVPILRMLDDARFARYLGVASEMCGEGFIDAVTQFFEDTSMLADMRAGGLAAVDGRGVQRIAERMSQPFVKL
jgi:UDP-2,4-diacetamido-2,4,6-trideoxy-beta-L-altropyranose hydrolase